MARIPLFLQILPALLQCLTGFCLVCLIFIHFCQFSGHYSAIFAQFQDLAEQCDTKAWQISLAEENWKNWPPLRGSFLEEQE